MSKTITKKIENCELIKVEKLFNENSRKKYYYNIKLEGIDDLLLLELNEPIKNHLIGAKIKYKLNSENEVSEFELL